MTNDTHGDEAAGGEGGPEAGGAGDTDDSGKRTYEEFTVSGGELLERVKRLLAEGNVRRVYLKKEDGTTLLEVPLTAGVAGVAVTAVFAPALVAVGAIAAMLTQVTIGVERVSVVDGAPGSDDGPAAGQAPEDGPS